MWNTKLYEWLFAHRHPIFLGGLISFFILPEIFEKIFSIEIPFQIFITILIATSIMIIHTSPRRRFFTYTMGLFMIALIFIQNNYQENPFLEKAAYIMLFMYFSLISFFLYRDLIQSSKVTASVIIGAFAGYFMIGVIFFFILAFLDTAYPDTLSVDLTVHKGIEDTFYFSFITLTTIGYGDFAPTSALGQRIVILEGLIGQFYLAIVMAILVGKFLSHTNES